MTLTYSNDVGRLFLSGLNEIIGKEDLQGMLGSGPQPGSKEISDFKKTDVKNQSTIDLGKIQEVLAKKLSSTELRGLLLRCGRASCKFFVKQYGPEMQVTSIEYRLLPSKKRLMRGLKAAAGLWGDLFERNVSVTDEGDQWLWQENRSQHGVQNERPVGDSYFTMGLLQEYLSWLSGGKTFCVKLKEGTSSRTDGCSLHITKQPIE